MPRDCTNTAGTRVIFALGISFSSVSITVFPPAKTRISPFVFAICFIFAAVIGVPLILVYTSLTGLYSIPFGQNFVIISSILLIFARFLFIAEIFVIFG